MNGNFLLPDDELHTLEAAFAFIESCNEDGNTEESATSDSDRSMSSPILMASSASASSSPSKHSDGCGKSNSRVHHRTSPLQRRQAQQQSQKQGDQASLSRSRASNTKAVNRYRKRSKAEILELREQVILLNARVTQLQNRVTGTIVSTADKKHVPSGVRCAAVDPVLGLEHAVAEYRKLQASQVLNRKLKDAMEKQSTLNKTLESIFQKHLAKSDMESMHELKKKGQLNKTDARVATELLHYVEHFLYANTEMIVSSINLNGTIHAFSNSMIKQDPMLGQVFEYTSSTPVSCSAHELEVGAWKYLFGFGPEEGKKMTREFTTTFDSEIGAIHIDGVAAIRKFVEADRVVITYTTLLSPLGSGLVFRENGWLVINDTSDRPSRSPTLLSSYRLYLEKRDVAAAMSPKTAYLHSFVLMSQGEKMRSYQQQIQNALLLELDFMTIVGQVDDTRKKTSARRDSMGLLLEDDDDTLQAALAFIDEWGSSESAHDHSASHSEAAHLEHARSLASSQMNGNENSAGGTWANIAYSSSIDSLFDSSTPFVLRSQPSWKQRRQKVVKPQDKLKARAANTRAVNRYRKRTKAEILALRDQVVHLEAHLRDLMERDPHSVKSLVAWMNANASAENTIGDLIEVPQSLNDSVPAARIAFAEYCKLRQSQRLNRVLKHALATHARFNTVLEHIFRIPFTNNNNNADDSEIDAYRLEPLSNDVIVFKKLLQYSKDVVYSNATAISALISSTNDTKAAFSNTVVKQDPVVGRIFEFTSNAPLSCTVQHAGARLWKHLIAFVGNQNLGRASTQTPYGTETSCGRQFATQYGSSVGDIHVNGISTVRRFIDHKQRIVITYTSLLSPVSTDAVYREHGWLILADAGDPRSSSPMTLFQTCYQLYLDGGCPESGLAPEVSRIHNVIMNTQGMRMRSHQLYIQKALLQKTGPIPVSTPMYAWLPNEWSHETRQATPQTV